MSKIFAVYRKNNKYFITSYIADVVKPDTKYLYQNIEKRECERYLELKGYRIHQEDAELRCSSSVEENKTQPVMKKASQKPKKKKSKSKSKKGL